MMAAVFKFKPIKPKALDIDAIYRAILDEAERTATDIETDFQFTVLTWEHQPEFEKIVDVGHGGISIMVGTDDEIYGYVNDGTKPHMIFPVNAKALRFSSTYTAKTRPGSLVARRGGSSGDAVFAAYVNHPGIKARKFDEQISKEWDKKFKDHMEQAMKQGRRDCGWAI